MNNIIRKKILELTAIMISLAILMSSIIFFCMGIAAKMFNYWPTSEVENPLVWIWIATIGLFILISIDIYRRENKTNSPTQMPKMKTG